MAEPIIKMDNISFGYRKDSLSLKDICLTIPQGVKAAFIGPNGAGKSTLFLHLNAVLRPLGGNIAFKGQVYRYTKEFTTELRRKIGLVMQDQDTQLFAGSVFDDVIFGPMNLGLTLRQAEQKAAAALDFVGMKEYKDHPIHFLSCGQKKRVAIAGVLAMEPEVLLMDEPTAGLDCQGINQLKILMDDLSRKNTTLIVATHDIDWVWEWADLVYVMSGGQCLTSGKAEIILNNSEYAGELFAKPMLGELYNQLIKPKIPEGERAPEVPRTLPAMIACLQAGFCVKR